jgi:hypothetical protein
MVSAMSPRLVPSPSSQVNHDSPAARRTLSGSSTLFTSFHTASVTEAGAIRFRINNPGSAGVWGFDGTVTNGGAKISGTHALVATTSTNTGTWTATRR